MAEDKKNKEPVAAEYVAQWRIDHDDKVYLEDDTLALTDDAAAQLLAAGAIKLKKANPEEVSHG